MQKIASQILSLCLGVLCFCALSLCIFALPQAQAAASTTPADKAAIKAAITTLLQENPDLVLDVLRSHSEEVLEIAQQGNMQRKRKALLTQWNQDATVPKKLDLANRPVRGAAKAPVTIVAYSDFTCPYCRNAEEALEPLLVKYAGKVRFVFKPLPKAADKIPVSLLAAKYSTAAFMQDAEKGWAFYSLLFAGAENLETDGDNFLKATAAKAGLDVKRLVSDAAGAKVQATLDADRKEADSLDIPGTPYFLVNNLVIRGAVSTELFEEAIQFALKKLP